MTPDPRAEALSASARSRVTETMVADPRHRIAEVERLIVVRRLPLAPPEEGSS